MPRRKERKIVLSELQKGVDIFLALKNDPILKGYDLSTFTISIKADITPVIKNPGRAAMFLEHHLKANPNCCKFYNNIPYVGKQKLAEMMRIPRSTLDKWLDDDLIIPITTEETGEIEFFDPYDILSQLKKNKN